MPGVAQVVAVSVSHGDQRLNGVDVLLLHLCDAGAGGQQGEPGQGLDVSVSLQLQTGDPFTVSWWIQEALNSRHHQRFRPAC